VGKDRVNKTRLSESNYITILGIHAWWAGGCEGFKEIKSGAYCKTV